jgi:hypothetical protein
LRFRVPCVFARVCLKFCLRSLDLIPIFACCCLLLSPFFARLCLCAWSCFYGFGYCFACVCSLLLLFLCFLCV